MEKNDDLRVLFVSAGAGEDVKAWSGIPYFMRQALDKRFNIVAGLAPQWPGWYRPLGRACKLLSGRRFEYIASPGYTRFCARKTMQTVRRLKPDLVFAVSCSEISHVISEEFPTVYLEDANVHGMMKYYPVFKHRPEAALHQLDRMEQKNLQQSLFVNVPSEWAAASARTGYHLSPDQVQMIPWGANFAGSVNARLRQLPSASDQTIHFLFVGIGWTRKGGQVALDTVTELNARGHKCHLDIVGCDESALEGAKAPDYVTFHGFLNKGKKDDLHKLEQLYQRAHFFFLPTHAECYGIVFAEAAAYGLPSISYATGGIPTVVQNGKTGVLLQEQSAAQDFARSIEGYLASPERYAALSQNALEDAKTRLNWDVWAQNISQAARRALATRSSAVRH